MKSKGLLVAFLVSALACLFGCAYASDTYADIGYSTGGNSNSSGGSSGGWSNYNCSINWTQPGWQYNGTYADDFTAAGAAVRYCPHWILVTGDDYRYLVDNKRWVGEYNGLDTCYNDEYVVISGNFANWSDYNGIVIQNFVNENSMSNLSIVGKTRHTIMSVLYPNGYYYSKVNYYANGSMSAGFFGYPAGVYNGYEYTYGQLLSAVLNTYNVSENKVASFCVSSVIDQSEDTTFTGWSWVTGINGDSTQTYIATTDGSDATVSFAHGIYRTDNVGGDNCGDDCVYSKTKFQKRTDIYFKAAGDSAFPSSPTATYYGYEGNRLAYDSEGTIEETGLMRWNWTSYDSNDMLDSYTYSGLGYGDSVAICQRIWYYSKTTVNGTEYSYSDAARSTFVCGVVTRSVPSYTLNIDAKVGTTATVKRTSSPYANAGTSEWSANNGTKTGTIYYGDKLKISQSFDGCYKAGSLTVDDSSWTSGNTKTVTDDVDVVAKAALKNAKLYIDKGTGTNLTVKRNNVELSNNTAIYCGETLTSTFSLKEGYSWGTHTLNDNNISSGDTYKLTKDNAETDVTVKTTAIRNSFSAQASVAEGTDWYGTSNRKATGYVSDDKSVSIDVDCENTGCSANYWLELSRDSGNGNTYYWTSETTNGNNPSWSDTFTSSFNNNYQLILGSSNTIGKDETLLPGQGKCHHLAFRPYGNYANNDWKQVYACANAKVTTFKGKSSVAGDASGTTDFIAGNAIGDKTVPVPNCDSVNGCNVTFKHSLKAENSIGSTNYTIKRVSYLTSETYGVQSVNNVLGEVRTFSGDAAEVYKSSSIKLYPGVKVCEAVIFNPDNKPKTLEDNKTKAVWICAFAEGNAQPDDPNPDTPEDPNQPSGDTSFLNIKVRNTNVNKYTKYQRTVYAKPTDTVTFRAVYNPRLQYTYKLVPDNIRIEGLHGCTATLHPASGRNSLMLGTLFNNSIPKNCKSWNNDFAVDGGGGLSYQNPAHSHTNGDTSRKEETNDQKITISHVGKKVYEMARTNTSDENKSTPKQVSFKAEKVGDEENHDVAKVDIGQAVSQADVIVPYNYKTKIEVSASKETVNAGEEGAVGISVDVLPKTNNETTNGGANEAYATKIPNAKIKLVVYVPGAGTTGSGDSNYGNLDSNLCGRYQGTLHCDVLDVSSDTLNPEGKMEGKNKTYSKGFNVPDMNAGTKICAAAAVYPSTSGADTSIDKSGSNTWNVSASKCLTIAKEPSIQVWGGSVYSNGNIDIPVAIKNNLAGVKAYSVSGGGDVYVFGSFTELGLVANGTVKGLASGAGTGFQFNYNGVLWPSIHPSNGAGNNAYISYGVGGSKEEGGPNYCIRSTLSFANYRCSTSVGGIGGGNTSQTAMDNKSALLKNFALNETETNNATTANTWMVFSDACSNEDPNDNCWAKDGVRYTYTRNNFTLYGGTISKEVTHVVISEGDVTIANNIVYADGYTTLTDIPKLIIYADNIWINCGVDRVDAVLIANTDVNTCYDSADINDAAHSRQLVINGSIITNTLTANRTYGAATGANSIIPAEIVNYDSTLYLWSNSGANSEGSAKLVTSYTRELSPRY